MKIILAAINAKYIHSNLAVYSLRAYAQNRMEQKGTQEQSDGHPGTVPLEIAIREYTINQTLDSILMDIYEEKPDVLCFSCYLWNIAYVEQLLPELPKILPGTEIWLGGPEVSFDAPDMLERYPQVRGIMCGEGEETFYELAEYYSENRETVAEADRTEPDKTEPDKTELDHTEPDKIRGIVYRREDGQICENPLRPVIDLSTVPFVYSREREETFRSRIIYYESSRGCPFSCSYCLSSVDKCLRFRDTRMVKRELQFFIDHEVPQVKFVDRTFNCRHDHAMEIWTYIRDHDRGITNFHFEVAADLLNEEEMALIRTMRPGLIQLEIGVQSVNERTIREIRRTMKLEEVRRKVALIREHHNVHQHLDLIAGLPFEDMDSFERSFNEVYAMRPQQLQLGFLKVLKGSLMHDRAQEYGLLYQSRPPYEVLSTRWITYSDVIRLKKIEEMVEVYYNSGQFSHTVEYLEKYFASAFRMYGTLAEYYERNGLFGLSHSRAARYEILQGFFKELKSEENNTEEFLGWLTFDLYLRDNVRNRPEFLGEAKVEKEEAADFYRQEAETFRFLKGYEQFDRHQIRKMTHLERIGGRMYLFDYRNRDPLTNDAAVYDVTDSLERQEEQVP